MVQTKTNHRKRLPKIIHPQSHHNRYRHVKFLEPLLLFLLHRQPAHGYGLMESLPRCGISREHIKPGVIYKYLRKMEQDDLIRSAWDTNTKKAAKRVYSLTDKGLTDMKYWTHILETKKKFIETLLTIGRNNSRRTKRRTNR